MVFRGTYKEQFDVTGFQRKSALPAIMLDRLGLCSLWQQNVQYEYPVIPAVCRSRLER